MIAGLQYIAQKRFGCVILKHKSTIDQLVVSTLRKERCHSDRKFTRSGWIHRKVDFRHINRTLFFLYRHFVSPANC